MTSLLPCLILPLLSAHGCRYTQTKQSHIVKERSFLNCIMFVTKGLWKKELSSVQFESAVSDCDSAADSLIHEFTNSIAVVLVFFWSNDAGAASSLFCHVLDWRELPFTPQLYPHNMFSHALICFLILVLVILCLIMVILCRYLLCSYLFHLLVYCSMTRLFCASYKVFYKFWIFRAFLLFFWGANDLVIMWVSLSVNGST